MCAAVAAIPVVVTAPLTDRSMSTVIVPLPDASVVTVGTSCLPLSTTFEPLGGGLGVWATAAHIHLAASGQNGPVIVPLNKTGDNVWSVPPSIRLNDVQYEAYKLGNLYVNVHSAANPGGEIRGQIMP